MLPSEPVKNIFAMRDALIDYLEPIYPDCWFELDGWYNIDQALWTCDHEEFKSARNAIVKEVEDERDELRRKLYQHELGTVDDRE